MRSKSGLSSIRILKDILPQTRFEQVYRALGESRMRYGNEVRGGLSDAKLNYVQRLQDELTHWLKVPT